MTTWIKMPAAYDDAKSLHENRYRFRGMVKCPTCGRAHELENGDSECENCGQLFNGGGQALRPQREWEEDY